MPRSKSYMSKVVNELRQTGIHWYKVHCPGGFKLIAANKIEVGQNLIEITLDEAMDAWMNKDCLNWLEAFRLVQTYAHQISESN